MPVFPKIPFWEVVEIKPKISRFPILRAATMIAFLRVTALFSLIVLTGCAHHQLRRQTTWQASTLSNLYEQQVLDNLAMFSVKPSAIPFFAYPNEGGTGVDSSGGLGGSEPLNPFFTTLGFDVSRGTSEAWVLTPVRDPTSLEIMQLAYQAAIGLDGDCCVELSVKLAEFRGLPGPGQACDVSSGWICTSRNRKDIPKCCAQSVGHYCGLYAWVRPGCEHEFSRLALLIVELAVNSPADPKTPSKKVTFYIDQNGQSTVESNAHGKVEAEIRFDAPVRKVLEQGGSSKLRRDIGAIESQIKAKALQSPKVGERFENMLLADPATFQSELQSMRAEANWDPADLELANGLLELQEARQGMLLQATEIESQADPTLGLEYSDASENSLSSEIIRLKNRQRFLGVPFFRKN